MVPRLLVIDDLFGRNVGSARNSDRESLCAHFLWRDVTNDKANRASRQTILKPTAEVVFCRGQVPISAEVGDRVENDLEGTVKKVREGWSFDTERANNHWAMILVDMCFYTGLVSEDSNARMQGIPEGQSEDDSPETYFGLELLVRISQEFPELPVFILSSKRREEISLEFSRGGALGFIARDDPRGPELLADALWYHGLLEDDTGGIVGHSLPFLLALREARRAARHGGNVLIVGERGSGKELLGRYIHRMSIPPNGLGKEAPYIAVNCALLGTELFASELFGIEPKTASGVDGKIGLVEAANHGYLFLDEIADMPHEVQAGILRVLQDREITRVGSRHSKAIDVRFLSATNSDLERDGGSFRADLLDRLRSGATLSIPPLRERRADIPVLAKAFVAEAESRRPATLHRQITPEAMDLLASHAWPGNIRELRSCLFDAVNRHPDIEYMVPTHLRMTAGFAAGPGAPAPARQISAPPSAPPGPGFDISGLIAMQNQMHFDQRDIEDWPARLDELQRAHARLLARYLRAALDATRRRTADHPRGIVQIHPAAKLITGDTTLTATKAADLVKRLLVPLEEELDDTLREAFEIAVRLRPRPRKIS